MSIHIQFFAQGEPKGQPRPRAFARKFGNKWSARVYDAGTAEFWKSQIATAAKEHVPSEPIAGPVRMKAVLYFPRPKYHYRKNGNLKEPAEVWHTKKPDCDNCNKAILDALTVLGFWRDDAQVAECEVVKKYVAGKTYAPGAMIEIREAVL